MFSLIYVWINDWVNNHEAGDLRRYRAHYDVIIEEHIPQAWFPLTKPVMRGFDALFVARPDTLFN